MRHIPSLLLWHFNYVSLTKNKEFTATFDVIPSTALLRYSLFFASDVGNNTTRHFELQKYKVISFQVIPEGDVKMFLNDTNITKTTWNLAGHTQKLILC